MRKEVIRWRKLLPFSLNLEEFNRFFIDLLNEFENPNDVEFSVAIELPRGVSWKFDSIEEMVEYQSLPDVIDNYRITMIDLKRYFYFSMEYSGGVQRATITASAKKEAWCAGIIDAASSALRKHRVWYYWIRNPFFLIPVYFVWIFFSLLWLSSLGWGWPFPQEQISERLKWVVEFAMLVFLAFMFWEAKAKLPLGAIRVKQQESFINRHYPKAVLLFGLIGAIGAIVTVINFIKS